MKGMLVPTYQLYNTSTTYHTHTHNHFTALLDFVWNYLGELAPEGKTNLDFLKQQTVSNS